MPERSDRGIPRRGTVLAVVFVLLLLAASGFTLWWKMAARELAGPENGDQTLTTAVAPLADTTAMALFLPAGDRLVTTTAPVRRQLEARSQAHEVITVLFSEDRPAKGIVLAGLELREVYVDAAGTAYIDLSVATKEGIRSSAWEELLAVYAVVNTVTQNVDEIKRMRFLLEGREAQTLAGHIDLSRTFSKRTDLVAQALTP